MWSALRPSAPRRQPADLGPCLCAERPSQWGLQFGDGGGMPVVPAPGKDGTPPRPCRPLARVAAIAAVVAALVLGLAVELLPTRSPEAGAVEAGARAVEAAVAGIEAAAERIEHIQTGDRT
jgi:hypothetical protein